MGSARFPSSLKSLARSLARSLALPINCARNASAIGVSDGIPRLNSCGLLSIEGYRVRTAYTDRGEDYVGVLAISSRRSWSTIEIDDNCVWTASELIKRESWKLYKRRRKMEEAIFVAAQNQDWNRYNFDRNLISVDRENVFSWNYISKLHSRIIHCNPSIKLIR